MRETPAEIGQEKDVQKKDAITADYEKNIEYMNSTLGVPESFDVIWRQLLIKGKKVSIYSINGLVNSQVIATIINTLVTPAYEQFDGEGKTADEVLHFIEGRITGVDVHEVDTMDKVLYFVLSGPLAIFVEGYAQAIIVDARIYPARNPEEPDIERVTRGSRDGFVETLVMNTALIRRRLRDPSLRTELVQVGNRSRTDVCILYLDNVTNLDMVEKIKREIKGIQIDGIPMAEKSVEEFILGSKFWNPFPRVRYTERPDVAAIHLLEGHVLILVDTSPSAIIAPATYWHHVQHAEEYRQEPIVGAFLRWVRFGGIFISIYILPLWLALALNPDQLPQWLQFVGVPQTGRIPLFVQVLMAEFGVDLVRMAAIHTPGPLTTALGLVATFMIGDVAIKAGVFSQEIMLYIAMAAVGTFATPSPEFAHANRLVRLFLVICTGLLGLPGFFIGLGLTFLLLVRTKSFGVPYLWPLIPLDIKALGTILVRSPVPIKNRRPSILKPQDPIRQPEGHQEDQAKR